MGACGSSSKAVQPDDAAPGEQSKVASAPANVSSPVAVVHDVPASLSPVPAEAREVAEEAARVAAAEAAPNSHTQSRGRALDPAIHHALLKLDARIVQTLRKGDIRLLRVAWLLQQPDDYLLQTRQELEALEKTEADPTPLLSFDEATNLIERGDRSLGELTYPWVTDTHPDPTGARLRVIRDALRANPHIEGLFIDQCCLYQHPAGGKRTEEEDASFCRALDVMADLYASAVGTTVLQFKEIPPRPKEFEGGLALFGLADEANETTIRSELSRFGAITSVTVGGWPPAVVRFGAHEAVEAALAALGASPPAALCQDLAHLYKEVPYDDKGWCEAAR